MKTKMARSVRAFGAHLGRGVWLQTAYAGVEAKLVNGVGAIPSDVWHENKTVGRISLHAVRPARCGKPFDGWTAGHTVGTDGMHGRSASLVIGRKHKAPTAIRGHVTWIRFQRHLANMRQASRLRLDAKTRDDAFSTSSHIQKTPLRVDRQRGRAAGHRDLLLQRELARFRGHVKTRQFVIPLHGYIHDIRHGSVLMLIVSVKSILGCACV